MVKHMRKSAFPGLRAVLGTLALLSALAACGGGGGGDSNKNPGAGSTDCILDTSAKLDSCKLG